VLSLEEDNVFKIASTYSRVRGFLEDEGWEFQGRDAETEMDAFRAKKSGSRLCIVDISEDFPATFLMGELSLAGFSDMARRLAPGVRLLKVDSSWEGKPTTIVVAMTEDQVRDMFGRRVRMRQVPLRRTSPRS